jgi:hypothetical protein
MNRIGKINHTPYRVSKLVNNAKNDSPDHIKPA